MYGLNSKVVKENGKLVEKVYKVGGMYTQSIEKIVYWLEKAITVSENANQKAALEALVKFYKSGDLVDFDLYNIAWVKDTESAVDVVNGFIEVYEDPLGKKVHSNRLSLLKILRPANVLRLLVPMLSGLKTTLRFYLSTKRKM